MKIRIVLLKRNISIFLTVQPNVSGFEVSNNSDNLPKDIFGPQTEEPENNNNSNFNLNVVPLSPIFDKSITTTPATIPSTENTQNSFDFEVIQQNMTTANEPNYGGNFNIPNGNLFSSYLFFHCDKTKFLRKKN